MRSLRAIALRGSLAPALRLGLGLAFALGACTDISEAPSPPSGGAADAGSDASADGGGGGGAPLTGCEPGQVTLEGGGCVPAGVPAAACPPGEAESEKGCVPAGIPAGACAAGFESAGEDGCSAILPADPCPKGLMAVPGETQCRPVAPCEAGDYGSIPVGQGTQFVRGGYAGGDSDGSVDKPWTSIQAAINAAASGAVIALAEGTYTEDLIIEGKPVILWGKCPELVAIKGSPAAYAAVTLKPGADGTELRDLAITGSGVGLDQGDVEGTVLDRIWIHDTGSHAIYLGRSPSGAVGLTLGRSLLEASIKTGVVALGGRLAMEASIIRDVEHPADFGYGLYLYDDPDTKERARATVTGSLIERSRIGGVFLIGSDAVIEASVIRDTRPRSSDGRAGFGISADQDMVTGERSTVKVVGSVLERNRKHSIYAGSSDLTIETTTVRDTLVQMSNGSFGHGIYVDSYPDEGGGPASLTLKSSVISSNLTAGISIFNTAAVIESTVVRDTKPSKPINGGGHGIEAISDATSIADLTLRWSRVEGSTAVGVVAAGSKILVEGTAIKNTSPQVPDNAAGWGIAMLAHMTRRPSGIIRRSSVEHSYTVGVLLAGADALIEETSITDTLPQESDGTLGVGLIVEPHPDTGERSTLTMRYSRVERSYELGVFVLGSDAVIEGSVVRDTEVSLPNLPAGRGIGVQVNLPTDEPASLILRSSLIEANHEAGISVTAATATIEDTLVRDTKDANGKFGDAIVASVFPSGFTVIPASVTISGSRLEGSTRAGIASFGATVIVGTTSLECNPIHLDGEPYFGQTFFFDNTGESACGCAGKAEACKVQSANLEPPKPVDG